ncbi:hypothetical protein MPTK1_8g15590 [Marchantia polymorpha subsp. ruderalis]|uniref:Uncharacterized protein n=1 Tax=Marchantia polymorpha TaxID=3197 RepID=A0A2R6WL42_MARPO|nr:hypothetical protein MARPO_0079s0054 [Marchantia polymorpha]BBN20002.1 hypothetical protein Mp_8g15590 [Marchantia polymorpha subsp. ruderalis]|eukprot:PTQ34551.1 hypothetical protein MARPO_0079s0054 [Marchantia polymorpha]
MPLHLTVGVSVQYNRQQQQLSFKRRWRTRRIPVCLRTTYRCNLMRFIGLMLVIPFITWKPRLTAASLAGNHQNRAFLTARSSHAHSLTHMSSIRLLTDSQIKKRLLYYGHTHTPFCCFEPHVPNSEPPLVLPQSTGAWLSLTPRWEEAAAELEARLPTSSSSAADDIMRLQ